MKKKKVWIDTDLSVGLKRLHSDGYSDVDDGYAVLQLLYAEHIEIKGISTVFGNTSIENAFRIGQFISDQLADQQIPVYKGAGAAIDLKNVSTNEAVEALAAALQKEPLTILAIGPATNIGILVLKYPELKSQITEIVLVAGRRKPTDYFKIGTKGNHAQDLNFDLDNDAFRILFEHQVPVVLCPFEISSKVWITQTDLEAMRNGIPGNEWLSEASQNWLQQWEQEGANGFNPFDVLASHYIIAPQDLVLEPLYARLEIHPDDTVKENKNQVFKAYLLCDTQSGYPVTYCYDVVPAYHNLLLQSLKVNTL
ncbi:nucleoside hydrolase [Arenibacter sp. GZD96]|uniref:nucleoside hydrolase n=1 Tax=Aurantibrevibacter litoralis TaxID=3106030 RepID=UPI002AFF15DF|nr:nucleoside hydrolase [Arenibacter sp. GZD-96]MEA1786427.1 nucleoside hydrolase [Arenibacter sp. GZD-96]